MSAIDCRLWTTSQAPRYQQTKPKLTVPGGKDLVFYPRRAGGIPGCTKHEKGHNPLIKRAFLAVIKG
jgi:hypothetical protein